MKMVVGNLKMSLLAKDINNYLDKIKDIDNPNILICPPTIFIPYFIRKGYSVCIQDISSLDDGCTGDVSALEAYSIGVKYTLIGHIDTRLNNNVSNKDINKKIKVALKTGLIPILCIGETKEERELLKTEIVLKRQIVDALRDIDDLSNILIAYNPESTNISPRDLEEIIYFIKNIVEMNFKYDKIKVLYGDNITINNVSSFLNIDGLSGILVGKSSKDVNEFKKIIEVASK